MPLTPLPFVLAYMLVFATAVIAVGSQIYRVARTNPVDVLQRA